MLMNFLNSWESAARGTSSTKITFFLSLKTRELHPYCVKREKHSIKFFYFFLKNYDTISGVKQSVKSVFIRFCVVFVPVGDRNLFWYTFMLVFQFFLDKRIKIQRIRNMFLSDFRSA